MSAPLAIDARGVTKTFGSGTASTLALRGVDFQVPEGQFAMLVGPSGSGKTTLLSILGCVLSATEGEVTLFGQRVSGLDEGELPILRRGLIGFIFQGHNLLASLRARENVALAMQVRGTPRREALAEADRILTHVGLCDRLRHRPSQLSGGELQRVAIARALAGPPPLILADEPTASLDAEAGLQVTELLRQLSRERGATVVVVTHDNRIFDLADRIVRIEDGAIRSEEGLWS